MGLVALRREARRRTPAALVKHLKSFNLDLKFSAGVWYFFPGGGRFHAAYVDRPRERREWLKRVFEKVAPLARHGVKGLEAHYPNEVDEENLDDYGDFERATGIRLITIIPNLFYDAAYEWGSLSSPIPAVRRHAIQRAVAALKLNKRHGTDFAVVWPGIDGFENPFGVDFQAARDRFAEGLAEAMDAAPGVRVAEEPKPYEPRGHILYGTTAEGILLAQKVESLLRSRVNRAVLDSGEGLVALNPEVGHMLMGGEDLAYAFSLVCEYGRLAHTHWNSQPLGNYDQDLNVGVISPEQTEAALYALKMHGYPGYFGIDINPERMPVERAIINCVDALRAANERINGLDHERVVACATDPRVNGGYLEAMLIRARAPQGAPLSAMPRFERRKAR
jgi:xylose isomerase